jgi:hypothetical protein
MLFFLDGPGLRIPWQTDSIKNVFDYLSDQERNDITYEAQVMKKNFHWRKKIIILFRSAYVF